MSNSSTSAKNKGGRPANPKPYWKASEQRWYARITGKDKRRKPTPLDPSLGPNDFERAVRCARETSDYIRGYNMTAARAETVQEWSERWLKDLAARGERSVADTRSLLSRIRRSIGHLEMAKVAPSQIEDVRDLLDRESRAGSITGKTAMNIWSACRRMFQDACRAKNRTIRVREDNPTAGILPPDRGLPRSKTVLYPDEAKALLSCVGVPLRYRELYAVTLYSGLRAGELEALLVSDIDFEHGIISVTKAVSRKTGEVGPTKTGHTGNTQIEPELLPLLKRMTAGRSPGDRVLWLPVAEDRASALRRHLRVAGITRPALYANDARSKPITFHDLRASHLTWRAIRGDDQAVIQANVRHKGFATTLGYIHAATLLKRHAEQVFGPLPQTLSEVAEVSAEVLAFGSDPPLDLENLAALWRPQRELKTARESAERVREVSKNTARIVDLEQTDATSRLPKPEPCRRDDARLRTAVKAAVDAGEYARAEAILRILSRRDTVNEEP